MMDNMMDRANLLCLVAILLINMLVGYSFEMRRKISPEELSRLRVAHIFWTINWLLWLLSWFVIEKSDQASIILNDLGAFSLIAFAIAFSAGTNTAKKYVIPLCSFFVLDCIYLLSANVLVHDHKADETTIPQASELAKVIQHHTILFGPSLCLTMLALGLVAWVLASRSKHFELGIMVGFVGVIYALSQIYVYQNGFFVPFLKMSDGAKLFLLGWRILFVSAYWLLILAAAGIAVAGARVWGVVSTAVGLISTIVALVNGLIHKH